MIEFRFLKRLSAGKNLHRATTKYHQNIIASSVTSEISSMTRILHRFHLSLASNRYLQTQRKLLIGFRCLQRTDRTVPQTFLTAAFPVEAVTQQPPFSRCSMFSYIYPMKG